MIILLSPSKTLDMDTEVNTTQTTTPALLSESEQLIAKARSLSKGEVKELMSISDKLAELNYDRFQRFSTPFTQDNAKACIYAFKGDVYDGLDSESLDSDDIAYAQDRVRILSGLYGVLRPLDLMQAYRLEMGIKLSNDRGKNLYEFWGDRIAKEIETAACSINAPAIINLASNEYFKAVDKKALSKPIITPIFKEKKGDSYKVIGLMAKRARGSMTRWLIQNRIASTQDLSQFNADGYEFDPESSTEDTLTFKRE